jgi:hypothetical protein
MANKRKGPAIALNTTVPPELREKVEAMAEKDSRSLSNTVVFLLKAGLEAVEKKEAA